MAGNGDSAIASANHKAAMADILEIMGTDLVVLQGGL
jgi:hypothetical protein